MKNTASLVHYVMHDAHHKEVMVMYRGATLHRQNALNTDPNETILQAAKKWALAHGFTHCKVFDETKA